MGVPTVFLKNASYWHNIFVNDLDKNPGDGLMYFYDFILNSPFVINIGNIIPKSISEYALLFNYLYSFSLEKNRVLTIDSERILALTMINNPRFSVPVYNKRQQIDFKLFNDFISSLIEKRSLTYEKYINDKFAIAAVEHWLWEAVLGISFPLMSGEWQIRMLTLWAGYKPEAIKRFVSLINSNRHELRQYLTSAEKIFLETKSLVGCNAVLLVDECLVPKMSSVDMMKRFHDKEHLLILKEQMGSEGIFYQWPDSLKNIMQNYPEWYIPTEKSEVLIRGTNHSHCVGSYANRHFEKPLSCHKTLLLFSDVYTAELNLTFNNEKAIKTDVVQVRAKFNVPAPDYEQKRVLEIANKMVNLKIIEFVPKKCLKEE